MKGSVYFSFTYKNVEYVSNSWSIDEIADMEAHAQALIAALGLMCVKVHGYINMEVH